MHWLTLSNIVAVFGVAALMASAIVIMRSAGRTQAAEIWREETDAQKARNERLQTEHREAQSKLQEQAKEIGRLQAMPDLSKLLEYMLKESQTAEQRYGQLSGRLVELFDSHEERATQRHEQSLQIFAGVIAQLKAISGKPARTSDTPSH